MSFDEKNDKLVRFTIERVRYEYDREKDTLKSLGAATGREDAPPAGARGQGGRGGRGQGGPPGVNRDFRNWSPDNKGYV